jgi:hypothetical protein
MMASRDHYIERENGGSPTRTADTHFDNEEKLRYELAKTVTLTPELYEKLFISPKTQVSGSLRSTFGNPTPIGVLGFSVAVFPLSCAFSTFLPTTAPGSNGPYNRLTIVQWAGVAPVVSLSQLQPQQSGLAACF